MIELKESWTDTYPIHSYEVDCHSCLSITSAINYFQESAWRNAESMGFGFKQLSEKDRFWVLSRLYLEMYRYPVWGDTVLLETWPKGMESLFALRDFRFKSADGKEILGAGTTAWLIIDGTTHRLQRIDHICEDMPYYPQNALPRQPEKIELPEVMHANGTIVTGYLDVDVNNHVNNVCYINWAINHLPVKKSYLSIKSIEVNYLAEALLNYPVEIMYGEIDNDLYVCSLRHPETGKEYCRCKIQINGKLKMEN